MLNGDIVNNLLVLLNIQSYSKEEQDVSKILLDFLPTIGFTTTIDGAGNVYGIRGEAKVYPLFNAHMDSVRGYKASSTYSSYPYYGVKPKTCQWCSKTKACYNEWGSSLKEPWKSFTCEKFGKQAYYDYEEDVIEISDAEKEGEDDVKAVAFIKGDSIVGDGSRPIGGDDKCGIAMAIQIAMDYDKMPMKLLFTVEEETGGYGIDFAINNHTDFFKDVMYSITIDRRGKSDLCIKSAGGVNGRHHFMRQLSDAYWRVGIVPNYVEGSFADVTSIRKIVKDCVNISCGYENPHTNNETVHIENFMRLYEMLKHFVKHYKPHSKELVNDYTPLNKKEVVFVKDTTKKKDSEKQNDQSIISDYYKTDYVADARKELYKLINTHRANKFHGCKCFVGLDNEYESIVNVLEYIPLIAYNGSCTIELKKTENTISKYAYVGLTENGEIVLIFPTIKEINNPKYMNADEKLSDVFANLF